MNEPLMIDLFAGAGGCSVGYGRAGFRVKGVDIEPHPDYPFELIVADAMDVLGDLSFMAQFDVAHLSCPCQRWATATADPDKHPDYITPARPLLAGWGGIYVIENVPQAPLINPIRLCGSSFGLRVRRHRHFESNAPLMSSYCNHAAQGTPVGVYGDHPDGKAYPRPENGTSRGVKAVSLEDARDAMGIDWMDWDDLTEAVPPHYTEYIGAQLIDALKAVA